jgi:hypothetical protein
MLNDPAVTTPGFHADLERPGATLLVAFGGLAHSVGGIPVFEFFSLVHGEDPAAKRLFLRDDAQCWYHGGVEGAGTTVPEVATWLRRVIADSGAERVVALGASGGGFAAILFGALTGIDEVHAFAPQTFVDRRHRALYFDRRYEPQIATLRSLPARHPLFLDLKQVVERAGEGTRFVIHYPGLNRLDAIHARRMNRLPAVRLHRHPFEDHNVVGKLRESGALSALLQSIVSRPGDGRDPRLETPLERRRASAPALQGDTQT